MALLTLSTTIPLVPLPSAADAPAGPELFIGGKTFGNKLPKSVRLYSMKFGDKFSERAYVESIGAPVQKFGEG